MAGDFVNVCRSQLTEVALSGPECCTGAIWEEDEASSALMVASRGSERGVVSATVQGSKLAVVQRNFSSEGASGSEQVFSLPDGGGRVVALSISRSGASVLMISQSELGGEIDDTLFAIVVRLEHARNGQLFSRELPQSLKGTGMRYALASLSDTSYALSLQGSRGQGKSPVFLLSEEWIVQGTGSLGPKELASGSTLRNLVSFLPQWMESNVAQNSRLLGMDISPTATAPWSIHSSEVEGVGVVGIGPNGASLRLWNTRKMLAPRELSLPDIIPTEDAVFKFAMSDGCGCIVAAVESKSAGGVTRHRLKTWEISSSTDTSTSHSRLSLDLPNDALLTHLAIGRDGTIVWMTKDSQGVQEVMTSNALHAQQQVLPCRLIDRMVFSDTPTQTDDRDIAEAAELIERIASSTTSKPLQMIAYALSTKLLAVPTFCPAALSKIFSFPHSNALSSTPHSLTQILLDVVEDALGASADLVDALRLWSNLCLKYAKEWRAANQIILPFLIEEDHHSGTTVPHILRRSGSVSVFANLGIVNESMMCENEFNAFASTTYDTVAPKGSMMRLALNAIQMGGMGIFKSMMPNLAEQFLTEKHPKLSQDFRSAYMKPVASQQWRNALDSVLIPLRMRQGISPSLDEYFGALEEYIGRSIPREGGDGGESLYSYVPGLSVAGYLVARAANEAVVGVLLLCSVLQKVPEAVELSPAELADIAQRIGSRAWQLCAATLTLQLLCGRLFAVDQDPSPVQAVGSLTITTGKRLRQRPTLVEAVVAKGSLKLGVDETWKGPGTYINCQSTKELVHKLFNCVMSFNNSPDITTRVVDLGVMLFTNRHFEDLDDLIKQSERVEGCTCPHALLCLRGLATIAKICLLREKNKMVDCKEEEESACHLFFTSAAGVESEHKLNELVGFMQAQLTGFEVAEQYSQLGAVGKIRYLELLMLMFERYNCLKGACELGYAVIEELRVALRNSSEEKDKIQSLKTQHIRVCHNLFKYNCDQRNFEKAYGALLDIPTGDRMECMHHLVIVMCETGAVDELASLPFGSLLPEVEATLQNRSMLAPIAWAERVYKTLYVFHICHSQYRSAAQSMAEYACRLGAETASEGQDEDCLLSMQQAYLCALNALRLVPEKNGWVTVSYNYSLDAHWYLSPPDSLFGKDVGLSTGDDMEFEDFATGHSMDRIIAVASAAAQNVRNSKRSHVLTLSDLELRMAVVTARLTLSQMPGVHSSRAATCIADLLSGLVGGRLFGCALQLATCISELRERQRAFEAILLGMVRSCTLVSSNQLEHGSEYIIQEEGNFAEELTNLTEGMEALDNSADSAAMDAFLGLEDESSTLSPWLRLQSTLDRLLDMSGDIKLWILCARYLLQSDPSRMGLPPWLEHMGRKVDWPAVVKLYMEFNLLWEASMIVIDEIRNWSATEGRIESLVRPGTAYIPYNLIDCLLKRLSQISLEAAKKNAYLAQCYETRATLENEVENRIRCMEKLTKKLETQR